MHPLLVGGNPFTTTSIYGLILYLEKNGESITLWEEQEISLKVLRN